MRVNGPFDEFVDDVASGRERPARGEERVDVADVHLTRGVTQCGHQTTQRAVLDHSYFLQPPQQPRSPVVLRIGRAALLTTIRRR